MPSLKYYEGGVWKTLPSGGSAGPTVQTYAQTKLGASGPTVAIAAAGTKLIPLPSVTTDMEISKSDGTNPDFERMSDGSLRVAASGFYQVSATYGIPAGATAGQYNIYFCASQPGVTPVIGDAFVSASEQINHNYPILALSRGIQLAANQRIAVFGYADAAASAAMYTFSIGRMGGPKGDTGASATIPMDPWHLINAAGGAAPAFTNGAGAVSGYTVRYRKDPLGRVSLSGAVSLAVGTGDHIVFTLPAGYWPAGNDRNFTCPVGTGTSTTVWVNTDGAVHVPKGLTFAYLDGVEFDTESVTAMPTGPQGPAGPAAVIPSVTVLPTSPVDGQEIYFSTSGVLWHMRYRASALYWEFLGGARFRSKATAAYTCAVPNAWEQMSNAVFPRFTIPADGVYRFQFGCRFQCINTQVESYFGIGIGTSPHESIRLNMGSFPTGLYIGFQSYEYQATYIAGQIISGMHNTQIAVGNTVYAGQWMHVEPLILT